MVGSCQPPPEVVIMVALACKDVGEGCGSRLAVKLDDLEDVAEASGSAIMAVTSAGLPVVPFSRCSSHDTVGDACSGSLNIFRGFAAPCVKRLVRASAADLGEKMAAPLSLLLYV
jgi:hypothetical protein